MATMPFGKFKNTPISELPDDYIRWLATIELKSPLREIVFAEIEVRRLREAEEGSGSGPDPAADIPHAVVQRWFRELVRRHHPDRGGEHSVMVAVTAAKDLLIEMLAEAEGQKKAA